jgi:hypothetical protein
MKENNPHRPERLACKMVRNAGLPAPDVAGYNVQEGKSGVHYSAAFEASKKAPA